MIMDNFPKKIPLASEDHDGLMSKEDKIILKSLEDKKNSLMQIIGRKIHTFDTINAMISSTNIVAGECALVLGSEVICDTSSMSLYLFINNYDSNGGYDAIQMLHVNLYARLILSINSNEDINNTILSSVSQLEGSIDILKNRIANILNNIDNETPTEIIDARMDETGNIHSCLKDRLDSLSNKVTNTIIKRYGVKFNGSSPEGIRLDDATNLRAEASTDIVKGYNDFDNIYPWSDIVRCNGYYSEAGNFIVTAYDGEPGFALDGSNGNVWVEIPVFYIREDISDDEFSMYISGTRLEGYRVPEKFIKINGAVKNKVYIAAYNFSEYGSISGVNITLGSYNSLLEEIREKNGNNFCGFTVEDYEIIRFLFSVEYATRNSQTVMTGATTLCSKGVVKVLEAGSTKTGLLVERINDSLKLCVNRACSIYTDDDRFIKTSTISNIIRCNIDGEPDNFGAYLKIYFFDIDVAVGKDCYLINEPWQTGTTDSVLGPSGSPVSNTLYIYPCRYRFIENPWGNQWSVLYQVLCRDKALHYSKDIDSGEYIKLSYNLPTEIGYISSIGYDSRVPVCRFANSIGGSSSSCFTDNFVSSDNAEETVVAIGGNLNADSTGAAGLYALNVNKNSLFNEFITRLSYNI